MQCKVLHQPLIKKRVSNKQISLVPRRQYVLYTHSNRTMSMNNNNTTAEPDQITRSAVTDSISNRTKNQTKLFVYFLLALHDECGWAILECLNSLVQFEKFNCLEIEETIYDWGNNSYTIPQTWACFEEKNASSMLAGFRKFPYTSSYGSARHRMWLIFRPDQQVTYSRILVISVAQKMRRIPIRLFVWTKPWVD